MGNKLKRKKINIFIVYVNMAALPYLNSARVEQRNWFPKLIKHNFWVGRTVLVVKDMNQDQMDPGLSPSFAIC